MSENLNVELIIHRLDEIARKQDFVNEKVEELSKQLVRVESIESSVESIKDWKEKHQEVISTSELKDLKDWKSKMDELMSPKQFESHIEEHGKLKVFKTQAMMIWVIVQVLMTVAMFWDKFFG